MGNSNFAEVGGVNIKCGQCLHNLSPFLTSYFAFQVKQTKEADSNLLDTTVVISATNLGNASAHSAENLPILVAGGGFRHQGHVAYDTKSNTPLSNLYLRALHQLGIE